MKDDCLFCKIVRGEVPSLKLYEDEDVLVMLDAYPDTDGHTLVIPKKHYADIYEVPKEVLQKMIDTGKIMAKDIMNKMPRSSMTFLVNYGDAQIIKHIHLHLLPNFGDKENVLGKDKVYEILTKDK